MKIRKINNKDKWENFLKQCEEKTFLDSWNWGEFQKKLGKNVWRFGIYGEELESVALVIKIEARRGTFLFVPHGPVVKPGMEDKQAVIEAFLPELKSLAEKVRSFFFENRAHLGA